LIERYKKISASLNNMEEEVKAALDLSDKNTNIAMQRVVSLFNEIVAAGFYNLEMKPRIGIGYSGDAAVVLEKYSNGAPLMEASRAEELVRELVASDSDDFVFERTCEDYSGLDRPVFLIREKRTGKKVMGLEWDKIVIYQPHEPNLMNYMVDIAAAIKSSARKEKAAAALAK